jgi:carbohydrate-binding DOMON domain-containing protein
MAQKVSFKDPQEDDNGPGAYTYPTDPVYKPGSFDMTAFTLKAHGDKVDLDVEMAAKLEDPWKTGNGFSVQMVFIFVQTRAGKPADGGKAGAAKAGGKNKKKGGTGSAGDKAAADKADAGNAAGGKADAGKAADKAADKAEAGKPAAEDTGAAATPAGAKAAAAEPEPGGAAEPAPAQPDTEQTAGEKSAAEKAAGEQAAAAKAGGEKGAERKAAGAKPAAAGKQHGFTQGLPGLQVQFSPADAWDRCIILSPEPAARVRAEVEAKAAAMKDAIVIPARVKGSGHAISATIDRKALGPGDPTEWGYQVVIASSDPYPATDSLLVRKVTETESQHRFGGASDGDCAPNVLDVLAGKGEGAAEEVAKQREMLHYECNPDHAPKTLATLTMVRVDKDED